MRIFTLLLSALLCGNLTVFGAVTDTNKVFTTTHFEIFYTDLDGSTIREIADSLEGNYSRIVNNLQAENLQLVQVHFYSNISDLQLAMIDIEPNLPSWAIGLATDMSHIYMLSPNHPDFNYYWMIENVIHEFAHCVSYAVNPDIANNPRWLWEAVAIYESNQLRNPKNIPYLVDQQPPSLAELNKFTNTYIYEVGYLIAEFIVETRGMDALIELINNHGDLDQTLSVSEEEFTAQWFLHVKQKYEM